MAEVEILLQAPDADVLAKDLAASLAHPDAKVESISARGPEALSMVTLACTTIATAHVLYNWIVSVRSRSRPFKCVIKVDGRQIDVEMPVPQFMKLFGK